MVTQAIEVDAADGLTCRKCFIMNSSVEGQEWLKFAPPTEMIPPNYEHFIEHVIEKRGEQQLMCVFIGIRRKQGIVVPNDGLENLPRADLETQAMIAGVPVTAKSSAGEIVEGIRAKKK